jgi:hypothetical protein
MVNNGKTIDSTAINSSTIYLRAQAYYGTSQASFSCSFDNKSFTLLGNKLYMKFNLSIFTGNKFCLFNYATIATGGHVDFDWFRIYAGTPTDVAPDKDHSLNKIPSIFFLGQNYPNPFNPNTIINYHLTIGCNVHLEVCDVLGREVVTLVNEYKPAGYYSAQLSDFGIKQSSGIYFYTLKVGNFSNSKKMILIK